MRGVNSPCLVSRLGIQASSRLMQTEDWYASLHGAVSLEVAEPALYAPALPWTAAPLNPALESTCEAVRSRSLDPRSAQGQRVAQLLCGLEERLDAQARQQTAAAEKQVADRLALEVEIALQAAAEAAGSRT